MHKNSIDFIYLDNCATTPPDPRVISAVADAMKDGYGNPSSRHRAGHRASRLVNSARTSVSSLIGASPQEVIFTSGATEAINLALRGLAPELQGQHIVASSAEHKAVLETLSCLREQIGVEVTLVAPRRGGSIAPDDVRAALRSDTRLVAAMWANNETGVLNPVAELGHLCRERELIFFTDATQAVGKVPIDVEDACADALAMSGHKFYGPQGVGALYLRRSLQPRLRPVATGGGQERGLRAGTHNVPGIVGLGKAAELAAEEMSADRDRTRQLRESLESALLAVDGAHLNGAFDHRLPNCTNISFEGVDGEALVSSVRKVCFSTGSACTSGTHQPSHVLLAMGVDKELASSAVRLSVGRFTSDEDVDVAARAIRQAVERIRSLA